MTDNRLTEQLWKAIVPALPPGLTAKDLVKFFHRSRNLVLKRCHQAGYQPTSERLFCLPAWTRGVDWSQTNIAISRQVGKTRERVRQMRRQLGKPRVCPLCQKANGEEAHARQKS